MDSPAGRPFGPTRIPGRALALIPGRALARAGTGRIARNLAAVAATRLTGPLKALTAKRVLDLALGTALLLLAAPVLTLAALALALRPPRSAGGVLRRETRVGLGGHLFELRSLRTRRFRLDLLSRLPHVVRGDLSLVGPAPLTPDEAALPGSAAGHWRQGLRPGLTGLAQVRARSGMPWDEPALLDAHYAEHHGTGLDLAILAQSVRIHLRAALRGPRHPGKAHLSDTDHRLRGYSAAE
ncbi:MAG TPA: sugar transferase [Streptomyces sp.]|uniref:sugar transferase n=1 Tax=Streptomyces sp. TaxID=1931 RepID=UPI002CFD5AAA|nr:sugar transferase [Streptomyces sp.]HWU12137.1 sugar transferase [Streptomyces sp.]